MSTDISELVLKHNGSHPYLKILKKKILDGEKLTTIQISMAEKMLITVAVKANNKNLSNHTE